MSESVQLCLGGFGGVRDGDVAALRGGGGLGVEVRVGMLGVYAVQMTPYSCNVSIRTPAALYSYAWYDQIICTLPNRSGKRV